MPTSRPLWKEPAALEAKLRAAVPAVRLVSERRIRWVIRAQKNAGQRPPPDPRQPIWADRNFLQDRDLVPAEALVGDEPQLLLLAPPDDRLLAGRNDAHVLGVYERLLFRGVLEQQSLPSEVIWARLKEPIRREVRFVLIADGHLATDATEADAALAFPPVLLERLAFAPNTVGDIFPLLAAEHDPAELVAGIDWQSVCDRLRLTSTTTPIPVSVPADESAPDPAAAVRADALDNHVRAAILFTRAKQPEKARRSVKAILTAFGQVMHWPSGRAERWTAAVEPLLTVAASGTWPHAARALYDLQRAAADLARPVSAIDPIDALMSFGRKPLRRSLEPVKDVILLRHLTKAGGHLHRVRLPHATLAPLEELLEADRHAVEERVQATIGPKIAAVFDEVGLVPANPAERVSRDTAVAELLDVLCSRGFVRLSDLRDALARNQLKLPDVDGPAGLIRRDPLLRADVRLADELYGVYHRGELYLRLIQRASGAAFGTGVGRFLTKYVALPFGGAFMALEFVKEMTHLAHAAVKWVGTFSDRIETPDEEYDWFAEELPAPPSEPPAIVSWETVLVLGLVFFLLLHVPAVLRAAVSGLSAVGRLLRAVLVDLPMAVWRSPPVQFVWLSRPAVFFRRWILPAALFAAVVAVPLGAVGLHPRTVLKAAAGVFVAGLIGFNSRPGRRLLDDLGEGWADTVRTVRGTVLPGLVTLIVYTFKTIAGWFERSLYAVDEWFRYRDGQTKQSLVSKTVLALLWFPIAYLARFVFYLLFEPQVNPLKHFPVVTVSHKMLLPVIPTVAEQLGVSLGTATFLVGCVPGVFGFLAWELMTNWRLYAANRPEHLPPTQLGQHGETVRGLLRPGFHSGTVPKLFRTLRHADAHTSAAKAKARHELDHLAHAVAALAERGLFPLWRLAPGLTGCAFAVEQVTIGCQRIELRLSPGGGVPLVVAFEHLDGRIVGTVDDLGWAKELPAEVAETVQFGLAGLFALGAAAETSWADWSGYWPSTTAESSDSGTKLPATIH